MAYRGRGRRGNRRGRRSKKRSYYTVQRGGIRL